MRLSSRTLAPIDATVPRRRPHRRALVLVLAIHGMMAVILLRWQAQVPAVPVAERRATVVTVRLPMPMPRPPPRTLPQSAAAGVKLAARPSVGLPAARTREHRLATMPASAPEPDLAQPVVAGPLPNLAAIDVAASTVGTGGLGRAGAGAGASGAGTGTGNGGAGKLFEECPGTPDRAMVADVYRLNGSADSVDAMRGRKPVKRVCLAQLDVAPRSFLEGFPGMDGLVEWFGLDIRFTVNVPEAGTWDLVLVADDGAVLSIDDIEVIDNDGLHKAQPKIAQVALAAGARRFRVRYFQGPREWIALQLAWKKPGEMGFTSIPRSLLGRPSP